MAIILLVVMLTPRHQYKGLGVEQIQDQFLTGLCLRDLYVDLGDAYTHVRRITFLYTAARLSGSTGRCGYCSQHSYWLALLR